MKLFFKKLFADINKGLGIISTGVIGLLTHHFIYHNITGKTSREIGAEG